MDDEEGLVSIGKENRLGGAAGRRNVVPGRTERLRNHDEPGHGKVDGHSHGIRRSRDSAATGIRLLAFRIVVVAIGGDSHRAFAEDKARTCGGWHREEDQEKKYREVLEIRVFLAHYLSTLPRGHGLLERAASRASSPTGASALINSDDKKSCVLPIVPAKEASYSFGTVNNPSYHWQEDP